MNTNQVKGKTKEILGEVQQKAGKLVGSTKQEIKGAAKQVEGKAQKKAGDVQEATKDLDKKTSTRH